MAMTPRVAGVILAAGESSRMGRDKALLPLGEHNFLAHIVEALRNQVSPLLIVLGHHADEIEQRIREVIDPASDAIIILRNPNFQFGQLSSFQVALRHLETCPVDAALLALVDHPAITPEVTRMLLDRFAETRAPIVIPTCNGRRGHPVLFARNLFGELLAAPLEEGAKSVVRKHTSEVEFVETNEEGILLDVDLPADYEALLARWESRKRR